MNEIKELNNKTSPNTKPALNVVYILVETDDTHGNKGVYGVFNTKEKAYAELKKRCGNDKWCSFIIEEWSVE